MSDYWFVIRAGNQALFDALKSVLDPKPGFHVVIERRARTGVSPAHLERRTAQVWQADDLLIARVPDR
jgi:hypothetical protein